MSNIYYLDNFRPPTKAATAPTISIDQAANRQRLLKQAWAARDAWLAVRAARELIQPPVASAIPTLQSATPIVLYFVSYGRNAWHSTWVQKYQRNTLKGSYLEAAHFIGSKMRQGTAFKMTITPGWHLQFSPNAFLVCEINTSRPFSRLLEAAFTVPGISEEQALLLLKPTSSLWKGPAPAQDSIIVQQTKLPAGEFVQWEEADEERSSRDWLAARLRNHHVEGVANSTSTPHRERIYDPREPYNYGRYYRDTSTETVADFSFRPCKTGGPSEFDCERFRAFAAVRDREAEQ